MILCRVLVWTPLPYTFPIPLGSAALAFVVDYQLLPMQPM